MGEKRYFWLKFPSDFFESKRIKALKQKEHGDTYVVIYLKMQLKALKTGGMLYFDGVLGSFEEELALDLGEGPELVKETIDFLLKTDLLEKTEQGEYHLTFFESLVGSETASTQRSRECRKKKALQCNTDATNCNANATEVQRRDRDREEIEIEKEIEVEKKPAAEYQLIADLYNETCVSFPSVTSLSENRKKAIKARRKTYSIADFRKCFEKAEQSSFLKGGNDRNWSATFDWMIKDSNMAKILDGNYDNKERTAAKENHKKIDWSKV